MEAMQKKRWAHYFLELGIVVLGVTLAFLLNNVANSISQSKLENRYLEDLKMEIDTEINSLEKVIRESTEVTRKLERIIFKFESGEKVSIDTLVTIAIDIGNYSFFNPDQFTYTILSETGNINIIHDQRIKSGLISLYSGYDYILAQQENYIQALDDNYFPPLFQHLDLISKRPVNPSFFRSVQFKNMLLFSYSDIKNRILLYQNAKERAKTLKKLF